MCHVISFLDLTLKLQPLYHLQCTSFLSKKNKCTVDPRQNVTRCCGNFPTASIFTKSLFSPYLSQQIKPQYNGIFYYVISLQRHFFCRPNLVFSYIFQPQYNVNIKNLKIHIGKIAYVTLDTIITLHICSHGR